LKKLISILLLTISLVAGDKNYKISGYVDLSTIECNLHMKDDSKSRDNNSIKRLDMVLNYDRYFGNSKFTFSQGYFKSTAIYNNLFGDVIVPIKMYYINELSYETRIMDNLSLTVGTIPFRNGSFNEYSFVGDVYGNGLMLTGYQTLNGLFLTYKYKDFTTTVGYGEKNLLIKSEYNLNGDGGYLKTYHSPTAYDYTGSNGMFFISKYNHGKHRVEFNYFDIDIYINKKYLANTKLAGVGYSWGDSEYSGNLFYGIIMGSSTNGNSNVLNNGVTYINGPYHFGKIETSGYQYLLGYKYTFDSSLIKRDVYFGTEYVKTSRGYNNLTVGKPFDPYGYGSIGNIYNFTLGLMYDKNLTFKFRYCKLVKDDVDIAIGGVSETVPQGENSSTGQDSTVIEVTYKF